MWAGIGPYHSIPLRNLTDGQRWWEVPERVGGGVRYVSGGKFRVYRNRNGQETCYDWEALTNGLITLGQHSYLHAMRAKEMVTDPLDTFGLCGACVEATSGQIYWGRDRGETEEPLAGSFDCH